MTDNKNLSATPQSLVGSVIYLSLSLREFVKRESARRLENRHGN